MHKRTPTRSRYPRQVISTVLATGASLFALDFAACGHRCTYDRTPSPTPSPHALAHAAARHLFARLGLLARRSEGEYISLGWYERDDVLAVIEYLRRENNPHPTSTIALWGRSMGAVSAVLQAARDPGIAGVVLDSPFASLEQARITYTPTPRTLGSLTPAAPPRLTLPYLAPPGFASPRLASLAALTSLASHRWRWSS